MQVEVGQFAAGLQHAIAQKLADSFAYIAEVIIELLPRANDHLCGGRGRRSAYIGGEIRDGEISFVADSGDDRNCAGHNGAGHGLLVKSPQILDRTAAPGEDQHVCELLTIEIANALPDFAGGAFALNAHGIKNDMQAREAALQDTYNVAHG